VARISDRRKGERRRGDRRTRADDGEAAPAAKAAEPAASSEKGNGTSRGSDGNDRRGSDRRGPDRRGEVRRREPRVVATMQVDCKGEDNFLFATASNVSSLGLFLQTMTPDPVGTPVELLFEGDDGPLVVQGTVAWVNPLREGGDNPNPGMGIAFLDVDPHKRERLVKLIRRIAYLADPPGQA